MIAIAATSQVDGEIVLRSLKRCAALARQSGDEQFLKMLERASIVLDGAIGANHKPSTSSCKDPCYICGKEAVDPECEICGDVR